MKRKLALLLAAMLLLTGCSSGGSGDTADGQDDGELETIDVVLDWYPNAVHAFLYEAEEKGYFAEEGLQVNILFPSNASDPLTMTAAGRADIGFYYQEDTIIAKANEDVPVKVLGAVVQQPISIVCALAEKNIKTPEDLIGKKVIIAVNLQPVKLCGEESSGMILATDLPDGNVQVIFVDDSVPNGSKLR